MADIFVRTHLSGQICPGIRNKDAPLAMLADSDDLAQVYRFDLAQDSEMISPTVAI